jgi:2-polyprenyl-3-methyl-5-hydroxy-6-metoxy-1,4-benzoquinol methylase
MFYRLYKHKQEDQVPNPDREYDKTHLSIDTAEERGFIHRDYIAHCFRWSHVVKHLLKGHRYKEDIILDVGCGRDQPLPRLLYANRMTNFGYVGIDINKLTLHETLQTAVQNGKIEVQLMSETDASKVTIEQLEFPNPTIAVSFEVLEHVAPRICMALVSNIWNLLSPGADFFVSTPIYNGSAAANHINEMSFSTVGWLLEQCGFYIQNKYGTFASQSDLKLTQEELKIWNGLSEYYDSNVLSTIFAPLHPDQSRNAIWHCVKPKLDIKNTLQHFPYPGTLNQHPAWPAIFAERGVPYV